MKKIVFIGVAVFALTGCVSSPKHECPLTDKNGRCASIDRAYQAAKGVEDVSQFQSIFETESKRTEQSGSYVSAGYAQPAERGKPVFIPPKVHRVWTAPWTDSDGHLHGGEYLYFTTPGKWSYGSLRAPGEASGVFKPVMPDTYGFTPVSPKKQERKDVTSQPGSQAQPAGNTPAGKTVNGVTQPQESLSE